MRKNWDYKLTTKELIDGINRLRKYYKKLK